MAFNAEIWDPGLLSNNARSSTARRPSKVKEIVTRKTSIMYRIFNQGDSTPESDTGLWGRSRRNYNSGSESDDDSDASSTGSTSASRRPSVSEKKESKNIFHEDSSDYESEPEEVVRKSRPSLFRDLLTGSRSKKNSTSLVSVVNAHAPPALMSSSSPSLNGPMSTILNAPIMANVSVAPLPPPAVIPIGPSPKLSPALTSSSDGSTPEIGPSFCLGPPAMMELETASNSKMSPPVMIETASKTGSPVMVETASKGHPVMIEIASNSKMSPPPVMIETASKESHSIFKDLLQPRKSRGPVSPSLVNPFGHFSPRLRPASPSSTPNSSELSLPRPMERSSSIKSSNSETSLAEKYGKTENVLGSGAFAVVKLCCPLNSKKKFAIKEFRKRRKEEKPKEYVKKLVAEFCISSSLEHVNVVKTVDLIQDSKHNWCVVMEYLSGGDLFARIHNVSLTQHAEINCYMVQLLRGVDYLHSVGVAHRDLKPENLLLDETGRVLKITDFGVSEVFRAPFCQKSKLVHGLTGSGPYIAPEEFTKKEYDPVEVDVWSCGIIFYVMYSNSIPWKAAMADDPRYKNFLEKKPRFIPFERINFKARPFLYKILEPDPAKRPCIKDLLEDEFIKGLCVCDPVNSDKVDHVHESRSGK